MVPGFTPRPGTEASAIALSGPSLCPTARLPDCPFSWLLASLFARICPIARVITAAKPASRTPGRFAGRPNDSSAGLSGHGSAGLASTAFAGNAGPPAVA